MQEQARARFSRIKIWPRSGSSTKAIPFTIQTLNDQRRQHDRREESEMPQLGEVMKILDDWVSRHGDGKYSHPEVTPLLNYAVMPDSGIQQERREIQSFVEVLLDKKLNATALEIGLGFFGSTHFLWRQIFKQVVSIETSNDRVRAFGANTREYFGKWILDDGQSAFLIGSSHDPATVGKAYGFFKEKVDLLFIDGDHSYNGVLTDWLLYQGLVRPGGIVAFHDCALNIPGYYFMPQFIQNLKEGKIDGTPRPMREIVFSKNLGIAWYEQV